MRAPRGKRSGKHPSRQVLAMATGMLGMGLLLLVLSFMAPATSVGLQAAAKGLRSIVPYPLLFGTVLLVLYAVLRPKPEKDSPSTNGPSYFGKNTTDFAYSQVLKPHEPAPEPAPHRGERQPASAWSAQVFEDIEWRRFEALCENLFGQAGFETRTQSHGADGGVDIWLYSRHAQGPAAIVQCKHWQGKPVWA